jgi:hypothetical protein
MSYEMRYPLVIGIVVLIFFIAFSLGYMWGSVKEPK